MSCRTPFQPLTMHLVVYTVLNKRWLTGGPRALAPTFLASATPSTASISPTTLKFPRRALHSLSLSIYTYQASEEIGKIGANRLQFKMKIFVQIY